MYSFPRQHSSSAPSSVNSSTDVQQQQIMSSHFSSPTDLELLKKLQQGGMFIKTRKNKTFLKRWKKMWVEGFDYLCWQSSASKKRLKIVDISRITPIDQLQCNKKGEVEFVITFRHVQDRTPTQIMNLVSPDKQQAITWINGLNRCKVASRAYEFNTKLRAGTTSSPRTPSASSTQKKTRSLSVLFPASSSQLQQRTHASISEGVPFSQLRHQLKKKSPPQLSKKREMASSDVNTDRQLFDFVVVVQLRESGNQMEPYISYTFPPATSQKKSNQNIFKSIPLFCFPDIDTLRPMKKYKGTTYSFILTDMNGERRHGYCLRMLPESKSGEARWPVTYCIISKEGCFQLFSEILSHVEKRNSINNVLVFAFLKAISSAPFPQPGQSINVSVMNPTSGGFEKILFERARADTGFEFVNFAPLFRKLSVSHILSIFTSLLFERRIIFISADISLLSSAIHACTSLLYPFEWIQILIPVLPKSLLSYVCSPIPFVVGVLQSHKEELATLPIEECVVVDLDSDRLQDGDSVKSLPQKPAKALQDSLRKSKKKVGEAFLKFAVQVLGDYKDFIAQDSQKQAYFDIDRWIASKPSSDQQFYRSLQQTQQFTQWMHEREALAADGSKRSNDKNGKEYFDEVIQKYR